METHSISPFFVGQEVVCIKGFEHLRKDWGFNYPKKGAVVKVKTIRKHWNHDFWLITIKGCGCDLCHHCFAPIIRNFQSITFEKVIEQELASVN